MYQTYYIDIDEEITSIVERLRNSKSSEVVIVVPKRALLIQSIVNLRLLKKEADGLSISLSIVTQDPLGKVLIEKAGILYQSKLDDMKDESIGETANRIGESVFDTGQYTGGTNFSVQGGGRLDKIGSDSYFDTKPVVTEETKKAEPSATLGDIKKQKEFSKGNNEKITNKELVIGIGEDIRKKKNYASMDGATPVSDKANFVKDSGELKSPYPPAYSSPVVSEKTLPDMPSKPRQAPSRESSGDRKIDNFFQQSYEYPQEKKSDFKNSNLSKHIRKAFYAFGIILILVVAGAAAYLFLPKATILITAKADTKSQDMEIKGDTNIQVTDFENDVIPAKLISETAEVSKEITSSGSKTTPGSSKKAHGTITIYNEFSSASQSLVATTRFESEDGKIFRIKKGITVPGTTTVSGEVKPGVIEAEVEADETGESYNIGPGKFTIPGFKDSGNDKYAKIYGKSTSAMSGGGSGAATDEGSKSVSDSDVANAKAKLQSELSAAIKEKLKNSAGQGVVVLDDAISTEEATYSLSNSVGDVVDKFQVKGQIKGTAIVFNEKDLKEISAKTIAKLGNGKVSIDGGTLTLSYGKADVDLKAGTMYIKINASSSMNTSVDTESLKKGILGKTNQELETYLGAYPNIEKVDVTYWPPFMNNKIPIYEKRVEVVINPDSAK
jgi:hypothetical protein